MSLLSLTYSQKVSDAQRVDKNLAPSVHYTKENVPNYPVSGDEFGATISFKW